MSLLLLFGQASPGITVTYDGLVASEYLASLTADRIPALESAASLLADRLAGTEFLGPILTDGLSAAELLSTARKDAAAGAEAATSPLFDGLTGAEWLAPILTVDGRAATEFLYVRQSDAVSAAEFNRALQSDGLGGIEALLVVPQSAAVAAESSTTVVANAAAATEWSGILLFTADGLAVLEFDAAFVRDGAAVTEVTASLRFDAMPSAEALIGVFHDASAPAEFSRLFQSDGLAGIEILLFRILDPTRAFVRQVFQWLYTGVASSSEYALRVPLLCYTAVLPSYSGDDVPKIIPPLPSVASLQVQTCAIDFGVFLPSGVTLTGTPTVNLGVNSGSDASPQSRLSSPPSIGTVPTSRGGTGIPNTAVIFQISGCLNGVTYTVEVVCPRSDGDTAEAWTLLPCVDPS